MKRYMKLFFAAAALFAAAVVASAVPALPGTYKYTQPDGTVIELRRHGDEFFSWTTRALDGQVMVLSKDGFWRPGTLDMSAREEGLRKRLEVNRSRTASSRGLRTHNTDPMTHGQRHIPVLLVQFSDLSFAISNPADSFDKLLNQQGYSANSATGSVRDFYYDNSHGAFEPLFDVYGPVTLSKEMSYYGQDNAAGTADLGYAAFAVAEAAKMLDSQIDFSNYDYDNDGEVDMILMYYAGYNEAEYGPAESIWPHQWNVDSMTRVRLDGKLLSRYFCTSELRGNSGTKMCGIGTTCHEFGHSLGLPDFYDTDYEENGECGALYNFSVMCSGSYNNDGRTPPYFNSEERIYLGWLMDDDVPELPDGSISLASVKDDYAYRSYTDTEGEYFIYECRDGSGWDAPLPKGLVVYHADKSKIRNVGGYTPYELWYDWNSSNAINAFGSHPCFYIIPSYDTTSLDFQYASKYIVFPGDRSVKSYSPVDWDGVPTGTQLSGIAYSSGKVTFTAKTDISRSLGGYVRDRSGKPLEGVTITVSAPKSAPAGAALRVAPRNSSPLSATTDSDGSFSIDLSTFESASAHVSASKQGFAVTSTDVSLGIRGARVNLVLYEENDGSDVWISYYDPDADFYAFGPATSVAAVCIPATELARFTGRQVLAATTLLNCSSATDVYIIAEAGGKRLLNHKVTKPVYGNFGEVDLSNDNLTVPDGQDLYMGIAINGADNQHPHVIAPGTGNMYYASYNLVGNTSWTQFAGYDFVFSVHIAADTSHQEDNFTKLAEAGYNVIHPGESTIHSAGEDFQLRLVEASGNNKPASVEWLFDGKAVSGTSVKLAKGTHKVTARLVLADGRKEVLDLDITAQ